MRNQLGLGLALASTLAATGCLSGFGGGGGEPSFPTEGAAALGDGLVGQIADARLRGAARAKALDAEYQALQFSPAGREVAWSDGRWQGQVTPTQVYRVGSQDCRGFTHTLLEGNRSWRRVGTACRGEDGAWRIVV